MNDYSHLYGEYDKIPETTADDIQFLRNLNSVLKDKAEFNSKNSADSPRLRIFSEYKNEKDETAYEEVMPFSSFSTRNSGGKYYIRETDKDAMYYNRDALSDATVDMLNDGERDLEAIADKMDHDTDATRIAFDYHLLHYLKMAARDGRLMVTEPGETVKNSHPIVLNEDNSLSYYPSEENADETQKSRAMYSFLVHSKHYDDKKYAEELDNYRDKLLIPIMENLPINGFDVMTMKLIGDALAKDITKEQFINSMLNVNYKLDLDLEDFPDEERHFTKPGYFSANSREKLTKEAIKNHYDVVYDTVSFDSAIKKNFVDSGFMTREEFESISYSRDSLKLFLEVGSSEGIMARNRDSLEKLLGRGCKNDDERQRAFAEVINKRMNSIANYDYASAVNLSDEKLCKNWVDIYRHYNELATAKLQVEDALTRFADNPYIDRNIASKMLSTEGTYMGYSTCLLARVRMMTNPYYSKLDASAVLEGTSEQLMGIPTMSASQYDPMLSRYTSAVCEYGGSRIIEASESIKGCMADKFSFKYDGPEQLSFFDKNGVKITDYDVYDRFRNGEEVYAALKTMPESLSSFKMGKNGCPEENPKTIDLPVNQKIIKDIKKSITLNNEKNSFDKYLDNYLLKGSSFHCAESSLLVEVAKKRGVDFDELVDRVKSFYEFEDAKLEKTMREELSPQEEIDKRRELTVKANVEILKSAKKRVDSGVDVGGRVENVNGRRFGAVMFDLTGEVENPTAYNRKMLEEYQKGTPEQRAALVKKAFEHHMEIADKYHLFDGKLSDEQLIEKYSQLRHVGVGMGMEFDGFISEIADDGVTLDERFFDKEFLTKLEDFRQTAYMYNNYYQSRMDYLACELYQYVPDMNIEQSTALMTNPNIDARTRAMATVSLRMAQGRDLAAGQCAHYLTAPERATGISAVISEDGTLFNNPRADEAGYGEKLNKGQTLYFMYDGEPYIREYLFKTGGVPPIPIEINRNMTNEQRAERALDIRIMSEKSAVKNNEKLTDFQKEMQYKTIDAKKGLYKALGDTNNPSYKEAVMANKIAVIARSILEKSADIKDMPQDSKEAMSKDAAFAKCVKDMSSSPFIQKALDKLPDNIRDLSIIDSKTIVDKVHEAMVEHAMEAKPQMDKQQLEAQMVKGPKL